MNNNKLPAAIEEMSADYMSWRQYHRKPVDPKNTFYSNFLKQLIDPTIKYKKWTVQGTLTEGEGRLSTVDLLI